MTMDPENGTITWTSAPPVGTQEMTWPVLRIPSSGAKGLIILSDQMLGTYTHYFGGRSNPCGDHQCKACEDGNQKRWHGYLGVWMPKAAKKGILEITEAAADTLAKMADKRVTLRALSLAAQRQPAKANGKLIIQLTESEWSADGLPPAPDLVRILRRIWGLQPEESVQQMQQAFKRRSNALNGRTK